MNMPEHPLAVHALDHLSGTLPEPDVPSECYHRRPMNTTTRSQLYIQSSVLRIRVHDFGIAVEFRIERCCSSSLPSFRVYNIVVDVGSRYNKSALDEKN